MSLNSQGRPCFPQQPFFFSSSRPVVHIPVVTSLTASCDAPLFHLCCSNRGGPVYLHQLFSEHQSFHGVIDNIHTDGKDCWLAPGSRYCRGSVVTCGISAQRFDTCLALRALRAKKKKIRDFIMTSFETNCLKTAAYLFQSLSSVAVFMPQIGFLWGSVPGWFIQADRQTHRQPAVIRVAIEASFRCWHWLPVWWFPACSRRSEQPAHTSTGSLRATDVTNECHHSHVRPRLDLNRYPGTLRSCGNKKHTDSQRIKAKEPKVPGIGIGSSVCTHLFPSLHSHVVGQPD